jgi:hypothetical protein
MHAPAADLRKKLAENAGVVFEDVARRARGDAGRDA